jgi:hypothetical protein
LSPSENAAVSMPKVTLRLPIAEAAMMASYDRLVRFYWSVKHRS